jgi:hypothetical protein
MATVFSMLLGHALAAATAPPPTTTTMDDKTLLHAASLSPAWSYLELAIPSAVYQELISSNNHDENETENFSALVEPWVVSGAVANVMEECDPGWMYKNLTQGLSPLDHETHNLPHLIWPADSF